MCLGPFSLKDQVDLLEGAYVGLFGDVVYDQLVIVPTFPPLSLRAHCMIPSARSLCDVRKAMCAGF